MGTFYLKENDTLPVLEVNLINPDNTAHDLTGATAVNLHIWLVNGTKLTRSMTTFGPATNGVVRYAWAVSDWDAGNLYPAPYHRMEYEVLSGTARITFPNDEYDTLKITPHVLDG